MPKIGEVRAGVPAAALKTGVYYILNTVNGKRYVGSSAHDLRERWWVHLSNLRKGCHVNIYLQRSFNKHGENAFKFRVIERVLPEKCVEREQFWMNHYRSADPKHGYNRNPTAGSMLGFRHSEETKNLVGEKGKGRKHTEDTKARISKRMSAVMLGNDHFKGKKHSKEARSKIAEAAKKQWQNTERRKEVSRKVSKALTGRRLSQETIAKRTAKQRSALVARNKSEEMRARISSTLIGHEVSVETRIKISLSLKKRAEALRSPQR